MEKQKSARFRDDTRGLPDGHPPTRTAEPGRDPSKLRGQADTLLSDFGVYHTNIDKVRKNVRQRTKLKGLKGGAADHRKPEKRLITIQFARGYAILRQMLAYLASAPKLCVPVRAATKTEDELTSRLERWASGVMDMVRSRSGRVVRDSLEYLVEDGMQVLGPVLFNPDLAASGEFPFEISALDPRCFAYSRSKLGLTVAVTQELRYAGELYDELSAMHDPHPVLASSPGRGVGLRFANALNAPPTLDPHDPSRPSQNLRPRCWDIPAKFAELAAQDPYTTVTVLKRYDRERETCWVDDEFVWDRKHFMGRVPFFIGTDGVPSDKPEERAIGTIQPILEALENEQFLFEIYATGAEYGYWPVAAIGNGKEFKVVQLTPGETYPGMQIVPVTTQPNPQIFELLRQISDVDIQRPTLPEATLQGTSGGTTSGYQFSQIQGGVTARLDLLRDVPEGCFEEFYGALLGWVSKFANKEWAEVLVGADQRAIRQYLDSFGVDVDVDPHAKGRTYSRVTIGSDDVRGHTTVRVSMKPNLPADKNAKLQRVAMATQAGFPFDTVVRDENLFDAEHPEEILEQRAIEELKAKNPVIGKFLGLLEWKHRLEEDKDMLKEWVQFCQAFGVNPSTGEPGAMPEGPTSNIPSSMSREAASNASPTSQSPMSNLQSLNSKLQPPAPAGVGMPGNTPPDEFGVQRQGEG